MWRNPTLLISSSPEWDIQQPESCRLHIPNREGAVSDCSRVPPRRGRREAKTLYCNLSSQRNLWQHSPLIAVIPAHSSSDSKESACSAIPGLGRSPWVGNGNPLQYSCLENSMDREALWATIHGVANNQPLLSMHACTSTPMLVEALFTIAKT